MFARFGLVGTVVFVCLIVFVGGAPGPDNVALAAVNHAHPDGFIAGIWHGIILPISFITSLFHHNGVYSLRNDGGWYNLGFLIGAFSTLGYSAKAAMRRKS